MKIRGKFILFMGIIVVFTATTHGLLEYLLRKQALEKYSSKQRETVFSWFTIACQHSLAANDQAFVLNYLKSLQDKPGIAYAYLANENGKILIHTNPQLPQKTLSEWRKPPGMLEMSATVPLGSHASGRAVMGFNREGERRGRKIVLSHLIISIIMATLAGSTLGLMMAIGFAYVLAKPIKVLNDGSEKIATGDFKTQVQVISRDELGEMARRFNFMARSLAALDEIKDSFLAQITHDLRNPLSSIMAHAEFLLTGHRGPLSPPQIESLKVVFSSANYLDQLIGNILDLTTLEAGRMKLAPQWVDLTQCVHSATELMKVKANEYKVSLVSNVPEKATVWADEGALRRVLLNLISNALKFTPEQGRVSVDYSQDSAGQDLIAVKDTGIGIPAEKLHTLFKKFSQIDETRDKVRQSKGTGLGLVICKQFVEGHQGKIWMESTYGEGTTFFFTLPRPSRVAGEPVEADE